MNTRSAIDAFLSQKTLAVAGVSRDPKKFGHAIYTDLKQRGYTVYPVNPNASEILGERCYPDLASLPSAPGGVLIVTPPAQTRALVDEAARLGVRHIWLQQGAETPEAVKACEEQGISVTAGECIFMFHKNTPWFHRIHRAVNGLMGKLPK